MKQCDILKYSFPHLVATQLNIDDALQRAQISYLTQNDVWVFSWDAVRQIPIIWRNIHSPYTVQCHGKYPHEITILDALYAMGYYSANHIIYDCMNLKNKYVPTLVENDLLFQPISANILTQLDVRTRLGVVHSFYKK